MDVQYSPFRELIKRPPLRWALYLLMLGVILLMVTTARRRQRVIPIIAPPLNKSLEFVRLIGTLYYQRCTHAELVRKKFIFFAEELRRRCGIDVRDVNTDDGEVRSLRKRLAGEKRISNRPCEKSDSSSIPRKTSNLRR